jgi:hypothetical protein
MRPGTRGRNAAAALQALAIALGVAGCASKCPVPVVYDEATLKRIEKAREALARDNILLKVLEDYENERDDLRFCR